MRYCLNGISIQPQIAMNTRRGNMAFQSNSLFYKKKATRCKIYVAENFCRTNCFLNIEVPFGRNHVIVER